MTTKTAKRSIVGFTALAVLAVIVTTMLTVRW